MARFLRTLVWIVVAVNGILAFWIYSQRSPAAQEIQKGVLLQPIPDDPGQQMELLKLQADAGRYYLRIAERHRAASPVTTAVLLVNLFFLAVAASRIKEEKPATSPGTASRSPSGEPRAQ